MKRNLLVALLALACASSMQATSVTAPQRRDIFSLNGKFVLDADPESSKQSVYEVGQRGKALWQFDAHVFRQIFYVSDGGEVVCEVAYDSVRIKDYDGAALRFHCRTGVLREYSYRELCPQPYTTKYIALPEGDYWRLWLYQTRLYKASVHIRTVDGNFYSFSIKTGTQTAHEKVEWAPDTILCTAADGSGTGLLALFFAMAGGVCICMRSLLLSRTL